MRDANWKFSDKYFHCKSNYQSASRGPGGEYFAEHFSNLREIYDQRAPWKGDSRQDALDDQAANRHGRSQAGKANSSCQACKKYRPKDLPSKY